MNKIISLVLVLSVWTLSPFAKASLEPLHNAIEEASNPSGVIYYDYLKDGRLEGGIIPVDPANRFHAPVPPSTPSLDSTTNVTTIVQNGPSSNRVDLVFVGDGYTQSDLPTYANDVSNANTGIFNEFPLDAYASFFNVHRVDVISNESGVDNDPYLGVLKDTALDMGFWCAGIQYLLCVDVFKALSAAGNAPGADQILAVANSSTYGGAGYNTTDLATFSSANNSSLEIALHEFGHSMADLGDEYDYGGGSTYTGPEVIQPNISIYDAVNMASLQTKWHSWLFDPNNPNIGTFEGAGYYQYGLYRPTTNSKMRSLGQPFEQVNAEQFIINFYKVVRPIDSATPPGTYGPNKILTVTSVQPVTHNLDVQWYIDGRPISGATGNALNLATIQLPKWKSAVSVEVTDNTPWVRDETLRSQYMKETRSWTILDANSQSKKPN